MSLFANRIACLLTAASVAVLPYHGAAANAAAAAQEREALEQQIEVLSRKAEQLRDGLKQERFDPEARVDHANYDLHALVEFVRDEVVFHPYTGTMRGAAGTLRSRAGSSLDQALLLAQMVKTAGFDARIVRADLSDELARRLLDTTSNTPAPASTDYFNDIIEQVLGTTSPDVATASGTPIEETTFYQDTQRHSQMLLDALEAAQVSLKPADATQPLLEKISSYFWVQYREGPSQPWQSAHPAFGGAEPPEALEPAEVFVDSIPDQYQHQFTMTAWIEQWMGGKIEQHRVTSPWTSPVSNLDGEAIRFQNVPDGFTEESRNDYNLALSNTSILTPFIGKSPAAGARAFDLQGRSIDPFAQSGPATGIFKTLGDQFGAAATGMADRADGKPAMALHSMYLEFTLTEPGGASDTRRRYILPPRQNYDDSPSEIVRQLITAYSYMISTGVQSQDYITDQFIAGTVNDLEWLKHVALSSTESAQGSKPPVELLSTFSTLYQLSSMDQLPIETGVVRFRGMPALVGIRDGFRDAQTVFTEVDVVWNKVESIKRESGGWVTVPGDALSAGVWDTVLERLPINPSNPNQATIVSTPLIVEAAVKQGIDLQVVVPDQPSALDALALDENEKQFVRRDLEAGHVVVIPQRTPTQSPMNGWWRVNPATGETLGMTGDGYGATMAEYSLVLITIAVFAVGLMRLGMAYHDCETTGNLGQNLCCALGVHTEKVGELGKVHDSVNESSSALVKMCGHLAQGNSDF